MQVDINYWAVLVAAVASMVVGFLWYGVFFKKQWMSMMGITEGSMAGMNPVRSREGSQRASASYGMKMSPNMAYLIQFVASLVMAYILSQSLTFANTYYTDMDELGWISGVWIGVWNWLGFVAPVTLGIVLWENKPWSLWLINASNYLVSLVVMGVILSLWR